MVQVQISASVHSVIAVRHIPPSRPFRRNATITQHLAHLSHTVGGRVLQRQVSFHSVFKWAVKINLDFKSLYLSLHCGEDELHYIAPLVPSFCVPGLCAVQNTGIFEVMITGVRSRALAAASRLQRFAAKAPAASKTAKKKGDSSGAGELRLPATVRVPA